MRPTSSPSTVDRRLTSPAARPPARSNHGCGHRFLWHDAPMRAAQVGAILPALMSMDAARRRALIERADTAGLDHLGVGDHVAFFNGSGADGLLAAAGILAASDRLSVNTAVYLLPLRHPVLVARQLADLALVGSGRIVFGVGIGGEDRNEVRSCGVDPATCGSAHGRSHPDRPPAAHRSSARLRGRAFHPAPGADHPATVGGDPHRRRRAIGRRAPAGRPPRRRLVRHLGVAVSLCRLARDDAAGRGRTVAAPSHRG